MKKLSVLFFVFVLTSIFSVSFAQENISKAIRTCEKFSQEGTATYNSQVFGITITLQKTKKACVYKEKIHQGTSYQMLTCNFINEQLPFLADSMELFNKEFKSQVAKNPIFGSKLTSNGQIFQEILVNPKYCEITYSKTK